MRTITYHFNSIYNGIQRRRQKFNSEKKEKEGIGEVLKNLQKLIVVKIKPNGLKNRRNKG